MNAFPSMARLPLFGSSPGVTLVNAECNRLTPSVVAFTKDGQRLVGQLAKRQAALNPEHTIYSIKRFIERRFAEVTEEAKLVPYRVDGGPDDADRVRLDDEVLRPAQVLVTRPMTGGTRARSWRQRKVKNKKTKSKNA